MLDAHCVSEEPVARQARPYQAYRQASDWHSLSEVCLTPDTREELGSVDKASKASVVTVCFLHACPLQLHNMLFCPIHQAPSNDLVATGGMRLKPFLGLQKSSFETLDRVMYLSASAQHLQRLHLDASRLPGIAWQELLRGCPPGLALRHWLVAGWGSLGEPPRERPGGNTLPTIPSHEVQQTCSTQKTTQLLHA